MILYTGGWQSLAAPDLGAWDNMAFSIDNLAYFGLGSPHEISETLMFWQYNPSTQQSLEKALGSIYRRWGASAFVTDKKACVIGGVTYDNAMRTLNDVWLFDPSKP